MGKQWNNRDMTRQQMAEVLRDAAHDVEKGKVGAIHLAVSLDEWGGTWSQSWGDKTAEREVGQLCAIDCEEHGWKTPWKE